ncbi:hypothetical protein Cantr_04798 [Candida viswanathii]|uniref:Pentamidine resistance factor, mitochondrial n=1 Tax=Candida viswanathii TaxID=5486 RepID=A0A367XQL9_9ASCO|nr:hypothetical protein Cantr_04798 [Candida viswanathii]
MNKLPTFYKLPAQKLVFLQDVKRSPRLASIWAYRDSTTINATKTLPISILSKQEIYNKVVEENPDKQGVGLKFKQVVAYGKTIINFYKQGIKNVWQNQSTLRKFKKDYYINHINLAGEEVKITIPSFTKLVEVLSQRVYMEKVELEAYNKTTKGEIKKDTDTTPILNLTREQFQIYKRTPPDFYKIPLFALVCLVFEELTPVLCYLVPEITPSTCILPNILPRVWNPKGIVKLKELNKDLTVEQMIDLSAKTSYNLDLEHVRLLCQSLRLVSRTTPIQAYPETYLRGKLQEYYNYLIVDNYYLSGLNKDGNLWNLTDQELIVACLERNLIQDIVFDTKEFNKISDPIQKKMFQDKYMNKLRVKLFQFLVDFPHFNIGYLSVHHVIPRQEEVDAISWR